jgi:hypothetical protein
MRTHMAAAGALHTRVLSPSLLLARVAPTPHFPHHNSHTLAVQPLLHGSRHHQASSVTTVTAGLQGCRNVFVCQGVFKEMLPVSKVDLWWGAACCAAVPGIITVSCTMSWCHRLQLFVR